MVFFFGIYIPNGTFIKLIQSLSKDAVRLFVINNKTVITNNITAMMNIYCIINKVRPHNLRSPN